MFIYVQIKLLEKNHLQSIIKSNNQLHEVTKVKSKFLFLCMHVFFFITKISLSNIVVQLDHIELRKTQTLGVIVGVLRTNKLNVLCKPELSSKYKTSIYKKNFYIFTGLLRGHLVANDLPFFPLTDGRDNTFKLVRNNLVTTLVITNLLNILEQISIDRDCCNSLLKENLRKTFA